MRLLIPALTLLSSALLAQWPQFRGNPALTGVAPAGAPPAQPATSADATTPAAHRPPTTTASQRGVPIGNETSGKGSRAGKSSPCTPVVRWAR